MLTDKQIEARVNHPDWPECLDDLSDHWHWLIELDEYANRRPETVEQIEKCVHELEDRFRRTFFPQIP